MINELLIKKVDEYLKNEKFISYGERYFKTSNLKLHPFDDFKLSSWDNWKQIHLKIDLGNGNLIGFHLFLIF